MSILGVASILERIRGHFVASWRSVVGCSIGVENINYIIEKIQNNGGQVLVPKTAIPYVGWIAKFLDTEGNLICGMQYENSAK